MKKAIAWLCVAVSILVAAGCDSSFRAGSAAPAVQSMQTQAATTPAEAWQKLRAGNARFVAGKSLRRDFPAEVRATAAGQYPFAVILSCLDSRQPIERIFDQGIGDLFNARIAGNVLNDDILGSLEFACKASGAKLVVVLGHTDCGAVKGAIDNVELGHLTGLLKRIQPAIATVADGNQRRSSKDSQFVQDTAEANVRLVMRQIRQRSPILQEMLETGQIVLVGGMYDLANGRVTFDETDKSSRLSNLAGRGLGPIE